MPKPAWIFALTLLAPFAAAGGVNVPGSKLDTPPAIDGKIDDVVEWGAAAKMEGMVDADTGAPYDQHATTSWLAYDSHFIYFAARCADTEPHKIAAVEYRTNVGLNGEDTIAFQVDPSGALADSNEFMMNAKGATSISLAGGRAAKREWTGEIVAKGRITAQGWEVEARIPWNIMKLPGAGAHNLRFNVERKIARFNRSFVYKYTNGGNISNAPTWSGVVLPKPETDQSIKLLPYTYLGYDPDQHGVLNSGLDLKTNVSDQIQLVGSINPDFRNIENNILNLDFSRFARLANESRPFFLEGGDYLGSAIFQSQQIQSFDVGVNTYGHLAKVTSFGFLNTTDFDRTVNGRTGAVNDLAAALNHQFDPKTSMRAAVTNLTMPGLDNSAYLVRFDKNFGPWHPFIRDMGSQDTNTGFGRSTSGGLEYNGRGWGIYSQYEAVAANFNPGLGFFPETGYKGYDVFGFWSKQFDKGRINDYGFSGHYQNYLRTDGSPYSRQASGEIFATLKGGLASSLSLNQSQFNGSNDHLLNWGVGYPRGNNYRNVGLNLQVGEIGGKNYEGIGASSAYRVNKNFQLSGTYQQVRFGGFASQTILSSTYDIDAARSIGGRLVKQGDKINGYVSLRKSGNRGAEYYLIVGDPNAATFRTSVILKLVVPFQIGK